MHINGLRDRAGTKLDRHRVSASGAAGFTLIEVVVFLVVVSLALATLTMAFNRFVVASVDPLVEVKALVQSQSLLDTILAKPFDEHSLPEGSPACGFAGGRPCLGIDPESDLDDVGDYHGYAREPETGYPMEVAVTPAGDQLGLPKDQARLVSVTVHMPGGRSLTVSGFKVNY